MSPARAFSSRTVLVRPGRGRPAEERVRELIEDAGIRLLEGVGVAPDADGFADDSTALTRHRVARVAGHPDARIALSADRESGFVFVQVRGRADLIARAEPALAELIALVASVFPSARAALRRI